MTQLNFTLDYEFLVGLFSEGQEKAFGKLMQEILNQFIKFESAQLLGADPHERTDNRTDYRNGERARPVTTRIGNIILTIPRHRHVPFKSHVLESYRRNERALICTMIEMVVNGVSTRKIAKVTEELCGKAFSKSTVSELCKELDPMIKEFRARKLDDTYPFVMVDATYIKVRKNHKVKSKALFVALGYNSDGRKEVLGFDIYDSETQENWEEFLFELKSRGLKKPDLLISDNHTGLKNAFAMVYEGVSWQRCQVHFRRNILDQTPKKHHVSLKEDLTEMFNKENKEEAEAKMDEIISKYGEVAEKAMEILEKGFNETMTIMSLPQKYRVTLRSTNAIERENLELKRRSNVIGIFPNEDSVIRLLGAILIDRHEESLLKGKSFDMGMYWRERNEIIEKIPKLELVA